MRRSLMQCFCNFAATTTGHTGRYIEARNGSFFFRFCDHCVLMLFRHSKFKMSLFLTLGDGKMCDCITHQWTTQKRFEIELPFIAKLQGTQFYIKCIISDVVPHDLELLFQGQMLMASLFRQFIYDYRTTMTHIVLLTMNGKSYVCFRLIYLHLILTISKGQGQGHAYFDNEYL